MISNLDEHRKSKSLTQQDVADKLGVTRQTYSKIEKGDVEPTFGQIIKISELFNIDIPTLTGEDIHIVGTKDFDREKYKQIITNFIKYGSVEGKKITKTKLAKLCYLLDFTWYYYNLEPITGLEYRKLPFGPVPDAYFGTIEELVSDEDINIEIGTSHLIENIGDISHDRLSDDEFELLQKIAKKWQKSSTDDIVRFTHNQLPWLVTYDKEAIPYGLITQMDYDELY